MIGTLFNFKPVNVSVSIANKRINPIQLVLTQEYGDHHLFEITLDYDMYGDGFMSNPIKNIELIGRFAYIKFYENGLLNSDSYIFKGVVTGVKQTGKEGKKGYLVISGASPTIMLEKGDRMDVYSNRSLYQIVKNVKERAYHDYLTLESEPVYKSKIPFLMQYNESDWDFLKRISYLYRENMFYDGEQLLFGAFQDSNTVNLTYDHEIIDLEFCSKMFPTNFETFQYVSDDNTLIERELPRKIENSNDYLDKAEEMSYIAMSTQEHSKTYLDTPVYTNSEVSEMLKREKNRNAGQTISIKGKSKTFKTYIGQVININMPDILSSTSNIGSYRIIKSIHRIDEKNRYSCEFEAVPASLDIMPISKPKDQHADSVIAQVKSNEDPLNQGRIQVDFDFASNYNYSWLRVLTPNAGASEIISQNRGMVFIPEKGDQVMIGFEYGDPNKPYVMGSLFHGNNSKGGGINNAEKSIITKSGVQIVFNDDNRSLHIQDPSGNTWYMDGQGNINVKAPNKIRFEAQDIDLMATRNLNIEVAEQMKTNVYGETMLETPRLEQNINDFYHTYAGKTLLNSPNEIRMESPETFVVGEKKLFFHSEESAVLNSKGVTEIKGAGGTNHSKVAAEHETQKEEIKPKCLVSFRPHSAYDGEFGFDWMRTGDSGLTGDNAFIDIMGKHYQSEGVVQQNGNSRAGTFHKDRAMYNKALRSYNNMIVAWKSTKENPYLYSPPRMTLLEGKTAKLKLLLDIEELPKKGLVFEFENKDATSFYRLSVLEIKKTDLKKATYSLDAYLSITAIKECEKQQVLIAKSDGKVCGKLIIYANAKKYQYNLKVVFVQVQTDINTTKKIGTPKTGGYDFFKECLHQALVIPQNNCEKVKLDCNSKPGFLWGVNNPFRDRFCSNNSSGNYYLNKAKRQYWSNDLRNYLEKAMTDQYKDQYNRYYRVYFIDEPYGSTAGFSFTNSQFGVYFSTHNKATIAHELFHAMGLPHTFDGVSPNAVYTYKGSKTNNIMDYASTRYSLFDWQWRKLNLKVGMENTISLEKIRPIFSQPNYIKNKEEQINKEDKIEWKE